MSDLFEIKRNPNIIEIPNNATNGDIFKTLFDVKGVRIYRTRVVIWTLLNGNIEPIDFQLEWWNAPYKKGENNERFNRQRLYVISNRKSKSQKQTF